MLFAVAELFVCFSANGVSYDALFITTVCIGNMQKTLELANYDSN